MTPLSPSKPSHAKTKASAPILEMCSVRVGETLFGIPIICVLEIIGKALPQVVPLAPPFIGGLVLYRGDVLTTVSLRQLLAMPNREGRQDILVLESESGSYGLLVDSVGEVLSVSSDAYEPNPCTLDERRRALFAGAYKLERTLLVMLDPRTLDPVKLNTALSGDQKPDPMPPNAASRESALTVQ